jgi:hypothetical protein
MLDKDFTKKLMFTMLVIGIAWVPVVLLSPIPNLFAFMAIYFIALGGTMYGSIKHDEYLEKKCKKLENSSNDTK